MELTQEVVSRFAGGRFWVRNDEKYFSFTAEVVAVTLQDKQLIISFTEEVQGRTEYVIDLNTTGCGIYGDEAIRFSCRSTHEIMSLTTP